MKAVVLASLAVLSLGVGGYFLWSSDAPSSPDRTRMQGSRTPAREAAGRGRPLQSDKSTEELTRRVARLEREVQQLKDQSRLGPGRGEGAAVIDPWAVEQPQTQAVIQEAVLDAVQEARDQERERRSVRRSERMDERRARALERFAAASGLGVAAQRQIEGLWAEEQAQLLPLIERAREGELSRDEVRAQVDAIRTQTDEAAYAELDPTQQKQYDEHRPGPGRRGPGQRADGPAPGAAPVP